MGRNSPHGENQRQGRGKFGDGESLEMVGQERGEHVAGTNEFKGVLPDSIANLSTNLERLTLNSNQIYGAIPSGIGNLANLYLLGMEFNQFTGSIPAEFGKLQKLQWTSLDHNKLSGKIPSSLGNLTSLTELHLRNNKLQKTIPPSLGQCQTLMILDLSRNELSGSIPQEIFDSSSLSVLLKLNLSSNHLVGSMPLNIGSLKNIMELDVSENRLSGEIPESLISCSSLESLYMQGNMFEGLLPESLDSLKGIQLIDISRNKFSGKIPNFLEMLPLKSLNLSFNDFEGEVPSKGVFANASAISVVGNTRLCGGISKLGLPKCSKQKRMPLAVKILISLSCAFLGVILLTCSISWAIKRRVQKSPVVLLRKELVQVSYNDLLKATDGFSSENLVGEGNFGSVYKGVLEKLGGELVAIKVLKLQNERAAKSFVAECKALAAIRHRNLVKVITCCSSVDFQGNDFKALVYQFMTNGSLEAWLHPEAQEDDRQAESQRLGLVQRINIAIDVACAMDCFHHQNTMKMIHCDLKPSNILLDADMTAHVGDFGLVRFLSGLSTSNDSSSGWLRGTIGYAAPEYGLGSQVSTHGDVYSYGIVLLEMMTGKRPTDAVFQEGLDLHSHATMALPDQVMTIVDPVLLNSETEDSTNNHWQQMQTRNDIGNACLKSLIQIGVACSVESPQERMDIKDVIVELQKIKDMLVRRGRTRH
ncbi:putative LRR receptor-like serine/threonine-protein kinase [Senna tora]|uniref:non-specific serine/threonine protein kinase n=1 Tax=Senna tora TaxID=362788 RepID=A0A834TYJ9_9FABA|nr:putative LRR receptor-like serine/threonine-protein kinase [Senna tora]